jgi:hypothetical protein
MDDRPPARGAENGVKLRNAGLAGSLVVACNST